MYIELQYQVTRWVQGSVNQIISHSNLFDLGRSVPFILSWNPLNRVINCYNDLNQKFVLGFIWNECYLLSFYTTYPLGVDILINFITIL